MSVGTICVICNHPFVLPQSLKRLDELIFSQDEEINYMCPSCFNERSNSEFRYIEGEMLCASSRCARNAMSFSKYCFKCDGVTDF